jgi:uncharacterized protein (DUF433 family)
LLANGDTVEELIEAYPTLTREDVSACLEYAGALAKGRADPTDEASSGE